MAQKPQKEVIEIADYTLKNPLVRRREVLAKFGKKWQIPTRTLDRMWAIAKKHNKIRLQKQEAAKDAVLIDQAKQTAEEIAISRSECIGVLANIIRGEARSIADETMAPTDADRIRAIAQLAKMQGWEAPTKVESDVSFKSFLIKTGIVENENK